MNLTVPQHWINKGITGFEWSLLLTLMSIADDEGVTPPATMAYLGAELSAKKQQVGVAVQSLRNKGVLAIAVKGCPPKGIGNSYRIIH